jgi:hypothetical protein
MHVRGKRAAVLAPIGARRILLQTVPTDGRTQRRHIVRLVAAVEEHDPLLGLDVTKLTWADEDALPFEMDLELLEVHGYLVPVTAGKTMTRYVSVRAPSVDAGDASSAPTARRWTRSGAGTSPRRTSGWRRPTST